MSCSATATIEDQHTQCHVLAAILSLPWHTYVDEHWHMGQPERSRLQLHAVSFTKSKYSLDLASLATDDMIEAVLFDALLDIDQ